MANADLARCNCPLCGGDAALRATRKARAYIMCDNCNAQIFARGAKSDDLIRARAKGDIAPPGRTSDTPAPSAAPVATVRTHGSDGEREEKTIFDILGDWSKRE